MAFPSKINQFKKGATGNPNGRPVKPSFAQYLQEIGENEEGLLDFEDFEVILPNGDKLPIPDGAKCFIKVANDKAKATKVASMAMNDKGWFNIESKLRGLYAPTKIMDETIRKPDINLDKLSPEDREAFYRIMAM